MFYVTGSTSGVGYDLIDIINNNNLEAIPIGSRNINNIKSIADNSNQKGFFVGGDIFDINSDAYSYFMNDIIHCSGTIFCLASVDMDAMPRKNENGLIEEDIIDPRNGEKWDRNISTDDKKLIREDMAFKQIDFYKNLFNKLLNRSDGSPKLTIIFANSIISKFYENHSIRHSQYSRLKNEITHIIELYRSLLKNKNVYLKNIFLGLIDTPMFKNRGELSAQRSKNMIDKIGVMIPLNGEDLTSSTVLKSKNVAKFLFDIGSIDSKSSPDTYLLFKNSQLDLEKFIKEELYKKDILKYKINKLDISSKDDITLSPDIKNFLNNLRATYLNRYLEKGNISSKYLEKKILSSNLKKGEMILKRYPSVVSKDMFMDMSIRMMSNYP